MKKLTATEIRKQVEVAKKLAGANYDRNVGSAGAYERIERYARENNAKALESICNALKR